MTTTKTTIPITEARKRIFDIAEEVQTPNRVYTITEGGKPKMVMMSAEEYESMIETMEVNRIFPNLDKEIAETEEAFRTGAHKKWTTLEQLEKKWGFAPHQTVRDFAVTEKPKKKYGVHTTNKTKGRKKSR